MRVVHCVFVGVECVFSQLTLDVVAVFSVGLFAFMGGRGGGLGVASSGMW